MPASPNTDAPAPVSHEGVLPRSNTEKRRTKKNVDSANLRSVDAKLSDQKRVSTCTCSLVLVLCRPVYCNRSGCHSCYQHSCGLLQKKLMKKLATIKRDGAVEFDIGQSARIAKNLFGQDVIDDDDNTYSDENRVGGEEDDSDMQTIPPLKIVMLIVGTRGDVQPFIAIGKKLQVPTAAKKLSVFL